MGVWVRLVVLHSVYASSQPSGENAVVSAQVEALRGAGHDVTLLERRTDDYAGGLRYRASAAWTTLSGRGASPQDMLHRMQPDIVHVHNTFPNWGTSWIDAWRSRTVVTLHNYRTVCAAATLHRSGMHCTKCLTVPMLPAVQHACYRGSRALTVPLAVAASPWGSLRRLPALAARTVVLNDEARTLFEGVLGRSVSVIPNFTDSRIDTAPPNGRCVFVGRLSREKGILDLIEHWPTGVSLDVIGAGPLEKDAKNIASRKPGVSVLGRIPPRELMLRMSSYEALVLPSLWGEGLPTVMLEALGCGVPCLISDRVSVARVIEEASAGAVFDPEDPASLRRAVGLLTANRAAMSESARLLHNVEYSRDRWIERIQMLYSSVVASQT